jgi:hypothetical protein
MPCYPIFRKFIHGKADRDRRSNFKIIDGNTPVKGIRLRTYDINIRLIYLYKALQPSFRTIVRIVLIDPL